MDRIFGSFIAPPVEVFYTATPDQTLTTLHFSPLIPEPAAAARRDNQLGIADILSVTALDHRTLIQRAIFDLDLITLTGQALGRAGVGVVFVGDTG